MRGRSLKTARTEILTIPGALFNCTDDIMHSVSSLPIVFSLSKGIVWNKIISFQCYAAFISQ